ncbi:MAG: sugar ABC transporter permease [Pseudomonadota bacterium]
MATLHTRSTARAMVAPSVILLLVWMIVPLAMTLYFSFQRYRLLDGGEMRFTGWRNYERFVTNPTFDPAVINTLLLVGGVLVISVVGGLLIALLLDQQFKGRTIVRLMVIAPFFVMPTVTALVWKNMLMNPVFGLFSYVSRIFGLEPVDWLNDLPLLSVTLMVSWQWLPFAALILLTALQSLDSEQIEAAEMDGASAFSRFIYITLPHLSRALTVVILIETIFLLSVFAEIFVTTAGGPGTQSTTLTYMVFKEALFAFDVGRASAGGIIAVILANIVAIFLIRLIGKNLDR